MYCHLQCDEVLCIVDRWEPSQGVKREGEREEERKSETNFFERPTSSLLFHVPWVRFINA